MVEVGNLCPVHAPPLDHHRGLLQADVGNEIQESHLSAASPCPKGRIGRKRLDPKKSPPLRPWHFDIGEAQHRVGRCAIRTAGQLRSSVHLVLAVRLGSLSQVEGFNALLFMERTDRMWLLA